MEKKQISNKVFFSIAAFLIIFDQITKMLVKGFNLFGIEHKGFSYSESISVIGEFIRFTFVENPGMAFGISFGWGKIFLSLFSIFAGGALAWYLYKIKFANTWIRSGITLILAGAVGNLIDRVFYGVFYGEMPLFYGKVVDFVQVDIPDVDFLGLYYTHFPVFNIADSCVSCGVVLLLFFHKHLPTFEQVKKQTMDLIDNDTDHKPEQDNSVEL